MTKKGPLGKAELFYVKEHCQTLDAKEIAKELDRPIATVRKAADKFLAEFHKQQIPSDPPAKKLDLIA